MFYTDIKDVYHLKNINNSIMQFEPNHRMLRELLSLSALYVKTADILRPTAIKYLDVLNVQQIIKQKYVPVRSGMISYMCQL